MFCRPTVLIDLRLAAVTFAEKGNMSDDDNLLACLFGYRVTSGEEAESRNGFLVGSIPIIAFPSFGYLETKAAGIDVASMSKTA